MPNNFLFCFLLSNKLFFIFFHLLSAVKIIIFYNEALYQIMKPVCSRVSFRFSEYLSNPKIIN
jgi:hypothetical protein